MCDITTLLHHTANFAVVGTLLRWFSDTQLLYIFETFYLLQIIFLRLARFEFIVVLKRKY